MPGRETYIVEHLDPELGPWSQLEYLAIAKESKAAKATFILSSLPQDFKLPAELQQVEECNGGALRAEHRGVEELHPEGEGKERVCLLDPAAEKNLNPDDGRDFDVFLFGGILGDDPPRDRTSELRKKGFQGRKLGPIQMTTDTAVRVTRMVIQEQFTLSKIPYADYPELKFNDHESTQMPFRYVKDDDGNPIMPEGMVDLIRKDADKAIDDMV